MGPALFRSCLALVLSIGFLGRIVGSGLQHRCPAAASAQHHEGHDQGGHGHHSSPGALDPCECVGQSCTGSAAVPVASPVLSDPLVAFAAPTLVPTTVPPGGAASHLLPFAQGPPAPALAV